MGIGFLGLGFQPKCALSDIPIMPKVILSFDLVKLISLNCALLRMSPNAHYVPTCLEICTATVGIL
jgi:hypothetical protein